MRLLSEREEGEAYLAAFVGFKCLLYFPSGGDIKLDLNRTWRQTI